jgi:hypothetical protein
MRFGYEQGQRNRLISLGELLQVINFNPPVALRSHFERQWLEEFVRKLILNIL